MAEEFQLGRGNWWESSSSSSTTSSSRNNKFESGILSSTTTTMPSVSTALNSMASNFGCWPTEIEDIKARSSLNPVSVSGSDNSSMVFPADPQKLHASESGGLNLQVMGLGLPSQGLDWNQPFFRGEKAGSGFRSILEEGLSSDANYQQEGSCQQDHHWTQKIYTGNDYNNKQMDRGISLDHQPVFNAPNMSSNLDNAPYGSPSNMLQGLLISDSHQESNFTSTRSLYYPPYNPSNCDVNPAAADVMPTSSASSSWSKFPKQQWPMPPPHGQSHFSGTPFWNATSAAMDDVRSGFQLPSIHQQLPNPTVDTKPKHTAEDRNIRTIAKKSGSEMSNKRPRNEAPSQMPAFKVRKEKMGDRITALQQLVSPFGKTDTASVLSEAIEYIKFLHEQVNVLSTPYMKSGASMQQHQQSTGDKSNVNPEGAKQDLRSRGLCLVPVSSTFPVTHETTVDFWTPTFGGTFR
ncbi:PREDICTED: transcription factor bHLH123-like [Nicotiana attenuata]|uniref:Transcription factor bhlh123 n=1 Tax=Nicotiana attenuata TaxID=49451 RepID=A0A314KLI6_NICAT|nr:PREDICTED: transcription factor bHLH123-like [Nicotiana attenuata]OIT30153.1 transcription factor bhlh123 [Nicotiana attenuata]